MRDGTLAKSGPRTPLEATPNMSWHLVQPKPRLPTSVRPASASSLAGASSGAAVSATASGAFGSTSVCPSSAANARGSSAMSARSKWGICSDIQGRDRSSPVSTPRSAAEDSLAVTCVSEGGVTRSLEPS